VPEPSSQSGGGWDKSPASMPLMPRACSDIPSAPGGREISRRSEMSHRWDEGETGRSVLHGQAKVRPVLTLLAVAMLGTAVEYDETVANHVELGHRPVGRA